jgi:hypothetical protein
VLVDESPPDPLGPLVDDPGDPDDVVLVPPPVELLAPLSEHAIAAPTTHRKKAFEHRSIIPNFLTGKISVGEWNSVFGGIPRSYASAEWPVPDRFAKILAGARPYPLGR